jgi:hypothetical protein
VATLLLLRCCARQSPRHVLCCDQPLAPLPCTCCTGRACTCCSGSSCCRGACTLSIRRALLLLLLVVPLPRAQLPRHNPDPGVQLVKPLVQHQGPAGCLAHLRGDLIQVLLQLLLHAAQLHH